MTDLSRTQDDTAPSIVSSLIRPVFALAAAAAVALPMLATGVHATPTDHSQAIASLSATFNRPAVTQVEKNSPADTLNVLQTVGHITSAYNAAHTQEIIHDYVIPGLKATALMGAAAGYIVLSVTSENETSSSDVSSSHSHGRYPNPAATTVATSRLISGTIYPSMPRGR